MGMGVTRWVILGGNGQSNLEKEGGCEEEMVHYHLNVSHVLLLGVTFAGANCPVEKRWEAEEERGREGEGMGE